MNHEIIDGRTVHVSDNVVFEMVTDMNRRQYQKTKCIVCGRTLTRPIRHEVCPEQKNLFT